MFFEAEWRGKLFEIKVFCAAMDFVKFSYNSELSSRFFSRLKFSVLFDYLGLQACMSFGDQIPPIGTRVVYSFSNLEMILRIIGRNIIAVHLASLFFSKG